MSKLSSKQRKENQKRKLKERKERKRQEILSKQKVNSKFLTKKEKYQIQLVKKQEKQILLREQRREQREKEIKMNFYYGEFENDYIQKITNMRYYDLVNFLKEKYGQISEPYVLKSKNETYYKNKNITRGNEGLIIHHILEYEMADLSKEQYYRYDYLQSSENLVYANNIEHTILHYLINKENPNTQLGLGGLFNHNMIESFKLEVTSNDFKKLLGLLYDLPEGKRYVTSYISNLGKTQSNIQSYVEEKYQNWFDRYNRAVEYFKEDKKIIEITPKDYEYIVGEEVAFAHHYDKMFMLISKDKNLLFFSRNKKGQIVMFDGKVRKIIKRDVDFILNNMDKIYNNYKKYIENFNKILIPISLYIKSQGGSGTIHGNKVDITYMDHVAVDLFNKDIISYTAPDCFWREHRLIHPTLDSCIKQIGYSEKEFLLKNPMKENSLILSNSKQELSIINKQFSGIDLPSKIINIQDNEEQVERIYKYGNDILKIQKTVETNIFYTWNEDFLNIMDNRFLLEEE